MIRERQTRSGKLLEADFFPVTRDGKQLSRGKQKKKSTEEQAKYNKLQTQKKIVRLVNANFGNDDVLLTLTYPPDSAPHDENQARRDINNYIRRIKSYRKRKEKDIRQQLKSDPKNSEIRKQLAKVKAPLKYIYVIEIKTYKTGIKKGERSYHFHMFLSGSGSGDRDDYEKLWHGRVNAARFRPDKFGPEAAAMYIAKGCRDKDNANDSGKTKKKKFVCSKNLKKPAQKNKDDRLTKRQVELMAIKHTDDKDYWERKYKGYKFLRCYARWNEFNLNWYVSVVMYKYGDDPPLWSVSDWFTYD